MATTRPRARFTVFFTPSHRWVVGLLAAIVFLASWIALGHAFYWRSNQERTQNHDVVVYQRYGVGMHEGLLPYRDFSVVYPPGALPVFLAPAAVASDGDLSGYRLWFERLMAVCGLLCLLCVLAASPPRRAVVFVALSPLLIGSIVVSRFDLWPAALVACAVAALLRDRHRVGYGALGAAFAAKLFAIVLVPIAVVWTLRRSGRKAVVRGLAAWGVVVAAAFGPFAILAPHGLWRSLHDQAARGVQIESLPGAALMAFRHPTVTVALGAADVRGYTGVGIASTAVEIAVLLLLWLGFARGAIESDRFVRYLGASICAFIALGKVISPQYLIWLVPLVPLVRGLRGILASGLLATTLIATQWYFPQHYSAVVDGHLAWLVLTRDLALVVLLGILAVPGPNVRWTGARRRVIAARE